MKLGKRDDNSVSVGDGDALVGDGRTSSPDELMAGDSERVLGPKTVLGVCVIVNEGIDRLSVSV